MKRAALVLLCSCGARTELDATTTTTDAGACTPVTRQLQVQSTAPWTDTGVDVTAGALVVIHASGKVRYGPLAPQTTDANGGNFDGQQFFATAVFPKAKVCSLIGRVGDVPVPKADGFVGVDYGETMTASGRLYLGFNDQVSDFGDNSGAFGVTLTTACDDR